VDFVDFVDFDFYAVDFVFCQWISILSTQLLLRVIMLARCTLSLCVCPSVRHTTESH